MHTIRLRGPWQIEPVAVFARDGQGLLVEESAHLSQAGESNVPGNWGPVLGNAFRGKARFVRRFGLPTNLERRERVYLVVGQLVEHGFIELNGTALGRQIHQDGPQRYEVTPLLKPRNELVITVESCNELGGILGETKLEIE